MKRIVLFLVLLLVSLNFMSSQNKGTLNNFNSAKQIRDYLASNIENLDPVEGEYDTQALTQTDSPYQRDINKNYVLFVVKSTATHFTFYILIDGEFGEHSKLRMESIGSTNAYRMYWGKSSDRAVLENSFRLKTSIELTPSDVKEYAANPRFRHRIILSFDMIKKYPTSDMYANAIRKRIEKGTKPTTWTGTGFALAEGYCVTNYHVVDNAKSIIIQGVNGSFSNSYSAKVIATDKVNDIALLKLDGVVPLNIPYAVKTFTSDVGEEVWVLGYPLTSTMGDEIKLTTGVVSAKSGYEGDVSLYQISAPIQPGNSGGPLFDSKGNVIGIVCAHHRGAENVNYAIKASYLRNLVESSINHDILPKANKISAMNLANKVKAAKNFVYYITCSSNNNSNRTYNISPEIKQTEYSKNIESAQNGNANAQYIIGRCFFSGDGVTQDYSKAIYWYRKSAEQGNSNAQTHLGYCYMNGYGVTQDNTQAIYWFKKAAEKGNENAKKYLEKVQTVYSKNIESAQNGNANAQYIIGRCFFSGDGVTQDYSKAIYWYRKSAEQGNSNAQTHLGYCYMNGYGVTQDNTQAIYWFKKAAEKGNENAKKYLEEINVN